MHTLHRILVNLDLVGSTQESEIKSYAEKETNNFKYTVFEWRTFKKVILGSDHSDELLQELLHCQQVQQQEIDSILEILTNRLGDNLSQIVNTLSVNNIYSYHLNDLAKILAGEYTFDSKFFDIYNNTARIDENTLQEVRKAPESYALVLFNYHT